MTVMKGLSFLSGIKMFAVYIESLRAAHYYVTVVSWQVMKLV